MKSESIPSWYGGSLDRSFMVDPLSYFSLQPVLHNWCVLVCVWDGAYNRTLATNWKEYTM